MRPQLPIDRDWIADFCRSWQIRELALFGSVLRNDFRPDSDVDVLVTFEPQAPWTLWDLSRMRFELEERFGRKVRSRGEEGPPQSVPPPGDPRRSASDLCHLS